MKFDRDKLFDGVRRLGKLSQRQVDALTALMDAVESDSEMTDLRWIAYALATCKHETAGTYEPIAEYGRGRGKAYGKKDPETGQVYYGRGFVQLTWKKNYKKFADLTGIDLVHSPDMAMKPDIAYQVLSMGMREGLFTGKKLGDYISDGKADYLHARKIINAMDKAALIAGYAEKFEEALTDSFESDMIANGDVAEVPEAPVAQAVATTEQHSSLVTSITGNEKVKEIASTGLSSVGNKLATGGISGGVFAAIGGFLEKAWPVMLFATVLLVLGFITWWFIYHNQHKEKQIEAQIASDPSKLDVKFAAKK